jgi:hypothetical protein
MTGGEHRRWAMTELFKNVADQPPSTALTRGLWARRATMTVFAVFALLALLGVFGQKGTTTKAAGPQAAISLGAPKTVRGGLLFQARIEIRALRDVEHPRLVLARGWVEGLQVNSIEPSASTESSRDGKLVLSYDKLSAGDRMSIWFQFQVNPTQPGRRDMSFELDDAEQPIARISRKITVLP